ncbi:Z-ring formation inhibitor MciZ [Paenibacillus sp. CAA11]|nr:Z-ring formation inhibitor MciZ [Paenibacillus sp. CAA11]AWB45072.1 Z-ring formation inhibitor MciZ [Paenibacillus sp. CAA11]
MKCYIVEKQLRLTGKAWEIRHILQLWTAQTSKSVRFIDWIHKQ